MSKKELIVESTIENLSTVESNHLFSQLTESQRREHEALTKLAELQAKFDAIETEKRRLAREEEEKKRQLENNEEHEIKSKALNRNYKFKDRHELMRALPYMKARDSEIVTGRFKNLEDKGAPITFNLHLYEGDEFEEWSFLDDETRSIPYGVAWHINNECYILEYLELKDEMGRPMNVRQGAIKSSDKKQFMHPTKKRYRFQFLVPGAPTELYPSGLIEMNYKQGFGV